MIAIVRRVLTVVALAWLMGGCAGGIVDAGRYSVTVINQHQHVFSDEEVSVGYLLIVGGEVVLERGAVHRGPVHVLAGDLRIDGRVDGSLTVLGGRVAVRNGAVVAGDVQFGAGDLSVSPGAVVRGEIREDVNLAGLADASSRGSLADRTVSFVLSVVLTGAVAWLMARLMPRPVGRVAAAASGYPVVSGALGVLVTILLMVLAASMIFTLFLIPLALIVLALFGLVAMYGLVASGSGLAAAIARRQGWAPAAPRMAMAGSALLIVLLQLVGLVPLLGFVTVAVVLALGIGAVLLTGFGTRVYTPPDDAWEEGGGTGRQTGVHS